MCKHHHHHPATQAPPSFVVGPRGPLTVLADVAGDAGLLTGQALRARGVRAADRHFVGRAGRAGRAVGAADAVDPLALRADGHCRFRAVRGVTMYGQTRHGGGCASHGQHLMQQLTMESPSN